MAVKALVWNATTGTYDETDTKLQNLSDLNVSLGAGVDEYALCWDNDTSKFLLRQISGIYAKLAGASGGQTLIGGTAANNSLVLQANSAVAGNTATNVVIQVKTGDGGGTIPLQISNGGSCFFGYNSPGAALTYPIQITGYSSTTMAGLIIRNTAVTIPSYSGIWGATQHDSASIGIIGPASSSTGGLAFNGLSSASAAAIPLLFTGLHGHTSPTTAPVIFRSGKHNGTTGAALLAATELAAQFRNWTENLLNIYGNGQTDILLSDAATNTVTTGLKIQHASSGTPAAGFGEALIFSLESTTTVDQSAGRIQAMWSEATHATRKAALILSAYDTAEREGLRIGANGSAPLIGFLGATPAARMAHIADAVTTHAITAPADAPADADALREDLVTNVIPDIEGKLDALATIINTLITVPETFGLAATS